MQLSWSVCPSTSRTITGPSIPWGRKTLSLFYQWGNGITESLLCCRQSQLVCTFSVPDFWRTAPDLLVKNAYFCLVFSAQNAKESKTIQDALAETVSVLLLWLGPLPLQFLPLFPFQNIRATFLSSLTSSQFSPVFLSHTSC